MDKIHIIDALGPFVEPTDHDVINWSKVNFNDLEKDGRLSAGVIDRIEQRFTSYVAIVNDLGYDSLSFDDLAHIVRFSWYNDSLSQLLEDYHDLYKRLFKIAKRENMKIFINTDYLFYNDDIHNHMASNALSNEDFFIEVLTAAFKKFPEIDGINLRIGENDGKDVKSSFPSKLVLRTPRQVNTLLHKILPLLEQSNKTLIFRTWTVGVYQVGDLIWNQRTFDTVFASIASDALIVSMKFGDTDFMKYLKLNPLFFKSPHKKIIELQTRREWEGMGTYPSFVGWDYNDYFQKLKMNETVVGIHVWCQTGGWAKKAWTNITYLEGSSFWNELNTYVTIKMYRDGHSPEAAIAAFCRAYTIEDITQFTRLIELSDTAIKHGLYVRELAEQTHYFRRSRVPTLLWLTWDRILLQPIAIFLIRTLVTNPTAAIKEARVAAEATDQMLIIARNLKLQASVIGSLEFQSATFKIFVELKKYILGLGAKDKSSLSVLQKQMDTYMAQYPQHYTIPKLTKLKATSRFSRYSKYPLTLLLRSTSMYRKRERILLATSPIQRQLVRYYMHVSKSHLSKQSMGIDVLFK
jgi:hypothetical protein